MFTQVTRLIGQEMDGDDSMSQKEATIEEKTYKRARDLILYFDSVDEDGAVLVFLPGIYEIENMQKSIEEHRER